VERVQKVARLDVAVDDAVLVEVGQRFKECSHVLLQVFKLHSGEILLKMLVRKVVKYQRDLAEMSAIFTDGYYMMFPAKLVQTLEFVQHTVRQRVYT
jgi:hypothetical protein